MPPRRPPSAVTTSTTSGWMSSVRPMTLGSTKFSSDEVGGEHDDEHDRSLREPAVAEGDDHRQAAAEERADVGDVAADEVHDHDREHERQAHAASATTPMNDRHDGRHDGASPSVVAEDPTRVADEVVELARNAGSTVATTDAPESGAVLEQVVHDERAEDHAAGDGDQGADAGDEAGEDAGRDRPGRRRRLPSGPSSSASSSMPSASV